MRKSRSHHSGECEGRLVWTEAAALWLRVTDQNPKSSAEHLF